MTFAENAALKALTASNTLRRAGCSPNDSGLEVDALSGAPGIFSARYAGRDATEEDNRLHLADELRAKVGPGWGPPAARAFPLLHRHRLGRRAGQAVRWGGGRCGGAPGAWGRRVRVRSPVRARRLPGNLRRTVLPR